MTQSEFAEIFRQFIRRHDRVILSGHVRPDGDSIGSCVALAQVLSGLGRIR